MFEVLMPVNAQSGQEFGPSITFTSNLNDLKGGSASAYMERQDTDGSFVRAQEDYDTVYSGTDVWAEEDSYLHYDEYGPASVKWRGGNILYDYGRLTVDYTYPDKETGKWSSDPFHICSGSYMDFGEASYSAADRSIVAEFPVWETLDPTQITLDGWELTNYTMGMHVVPELVSLTGWKDTDGNAWLRVIVRTEEALSVGEYTLSIDTSIDTDPGNYWTDNTIANLNITEASETHTAPVFTLVMPFNQPDGTPPQIRWNTQLNDLKGGTATATVRSLSSSGIATIATAEYSGGDSWNEVVHCANIADLQNMWMGNSILYGRCYIQITYTYPDGTSDQWDSKAFHVGYGSYCLPGQGSHDSENNLIAGECPVWDGLDDPGAMIEVRNVRLTDRNSGNTLSGTLVSYNAWMEDCGDARLNIVYRPSETLPAGDYRISYDLNCDPDGNNAWTDSGYIDFTVE
ncbi:MAG: hypothetical protein IKS37_00025 [Solobacterium sp.]|nr:hypothetical protein [Solobacterium sp.]